jgi:cell division protein FtsB
MGESVNPQRKWGNVVIGLVVAYLLFSGNRGLWNLYKLHQEKQAISEQIAQLKAEINRSQMEYKAYEKNSSAMEKQAREELNLVKPGEMVYKFSKTEGR